MHAEPANQLSENEFLKEDVSEESSSESEDVVIGQAP
jgi:hypothetical protein